jgi:hypothetical protein
MCVIITGIKRKPTLVELLAAEDQNPDGGGMAWSTPKGVEFVKGLTAEEIHETLLGLDDSTRWVVHFRYATIGDPQAGLCHPFPIQKDTNLNTEGRVGRVLFHNGTVPDWKKRLKDITLDPTFEVEIPAGDWSDSRGVAWLLALNDSTRPLNFIEGKFVVVNRRGILVFPKGRVGWVEEQGILYSNTYWRGRIPAVIARMEPERRQQNLPLVTGRGSGTGRSLVDEVMEMLAEEDATADIEAAEAEAMDLAAPKKKAKKKNARKRKARKLRQAK